ncbi:hypothetical protein AXF42_Ash010650 [Apostasia shenzhenica]|uniref:Uncharacterized protein n=1 Tax=Apostasia shenzhenica TaxID=1088818 RepID=A0A2I0A6N9_9ASPA|nr:hypothetical protein AXF42_Ash010650 [Apostasia shenzhenica]
MLCDPAGSAFLNIDHDTPTIIFKSIKAIKRRSFALFDLNIGQVSHLPVGPRQDPRDPGLIPAHSAEAAAEPSRRSLATPSAFALAHPRSQARVWRPPPSPLQAQHFCLTGGRNARIAAVAAAQIGTMIAYPIQPLGHNP